MTTTLSSFSLSSKENEYVGGQNLGNLSISNEVNDFPIDNAQSNANIDRNYNSNSAYSLYSTESNTELNNVSNNYNVDNTHMNSYMEDEYQIEYQEVYDNENNVNSNDNYIKDEYDDFMKDTDPLDTEIEMMNDSSKDATDVTVSLTSDEDLRTRLTKLRRFYTNATMTGENDRFGFEQGIMDVELLFNDLNKRFNSEKESIKSELLLVEKERDVKVKEWRDRYQKLHEQWADCMEQLREIQNEKEDLRQQRDLLLCSHKAKKAMTEHGSSMASGQKDKIILKEFFQKRVIFRFLSAIAEAIGAERGAIFVNEHNYLKSIALYPPLSKDGKVVEIKVPSDQGFVGTVFKNNEALNILNAYKDKRFYRKVDNETGFITRVVLCYPLVSPTTGKPIGVLQLINKENGEVFTVEDEARMSEYVYLISHVLESVEKLYSFPSFMKSEHEQSQDQGKSTTPTGNFRRKNVINVKRIGADRDTEYPLTDGQKMRKLLIPKEIEEYIRNVEQGWRKAVGESAEYQNKKAQLEDERTQLKTELGTLEKQLQDKEQAIQELQAKMQKFQRDIKVQMQNWQDREKEMKQEIKELKQLHNTLHRQNSTLDHMKLRQSLKGQSRRPSGLQLPYLDAFKSSNTSPNHKQGELPPSSLVALADPQNNEDTVATHSPSNIGSSKYRDLFTDMFAQNPVPMLLLTRQYRIWRVNQKFCTLLDSSEQELLGILLSDIAVGVDNDTLPKLLQFDVVQGLGIQKPSLSDSKKSTLTDPKKQGQLFIKVNMQVSIIGQNGQRFQSQKNGTLRGPIYCCTFSKKRS